MKDVMRVARFMRNCLAAFGLSVFVLIGYYSYCMYRVVKATTYCIQPQEER